MIMRRSKLDKMLPLSWHRKDAAIAGSEDQPKIGFKEVGTLIILLQYEVNG